MNAQVRGKLDLQFTNEASRTRMKLREVHPPSKVIRAFDIANGGALVHLHNVSGGVLSGDHYEFIVDIERNAYAQITTTSATRIYRQREGMPISTQINRIHVAQNGLLEWLPDPIIPFADSAYEQRTHITLETGASLFYWETVAPGREASGERFLYEKLVLMLEIQAQGRPIAIENIQLEPHKRSLSSSARLGNYDYFTTFYICKVGIEVAQWLALETALTEIAAQHNQHGETVWGVSALVQHGVVIRGLAREGRQLSTGLFAFWNAARQALYKEAAVLPRKVT